MTATSPDERKRRRPVSRRKKGLGSKSGDRPFRVYTFKGKREKFSDPELPKGLVWAVLAQDPGPLTYAGLKLVPKGFLADRPDGARSRQETEIDPAAFTPSRRAQALLRGREIAGQDLQSAGGTYDLAEVRSLLGGISRQAVDKRVRAGSLVTVPGPGRRRRYPTIQFRADGSVVPGLPELQRALPTSNPWAVLNFLVQPEPRLDGRTPIALLSTGEVTLAIEAARRLGEQGA